MWFMDHHIITSEVKCAWWAVPHVEKIITLHKIPLETSLVVQWLRLCPSTAGGTGSIPGWGTKIPHATQPKINQEGRLCLNK